MGDAASRISLTASGQSQAIEGHVSITATPVLATYHLPAILKRLRDEAPGIVIEIIASNEVRDLTRREADIAIRHARPKQPDLIAKLIGETSAHLYASKEYLDKHGRPESPDDLVDADFIGFEHPERLVPMVNAMGLPLTKNNFKIKVNITLNLNVVVNFKINFSIKINLKAPININLPFNFNNLLLS